ncbi:MAG: energy transducer TonB, partial [Myxococcota bacterium]
MLSLVPCLVRADEVVPPRLLERPEPVYPEAERARRADARVVLLLTVGEDGSVREVEVVESGGASFDQAAVEAVKRWRFEPARLDGNATAVRI